MNYLCNSKSEISIVTNPVEGHCLQVMKIVHHHDWLISEHQSVNAREKQFLYYTFCKIQNVHSVSQLKLMRNTMPPYAEDDAV